MTSREHKCDDVKVSTRDDYFMKTKGVVMKFATLVLAVIVMALGSHQAAAADLNVCGQLNAYQTATGKDGKPQDVILSLRTATGFVDYRLVLTGSVPADLAQNPALPEILRLTGRTVEGINTVADYTVVRVASCSLPTTSTATTTYTDPSASIATLLVMLFAVASAVVIRVAQRRGAL